jgi:CRP/FNR family transcriptional regulator, cyclic AMP receptor protein
VPAVQDPTTLRQVPLFADMVTPELAVLNSLMRQHTLPAGARILMTDQLEDTTYVVRTGVVKRVVEQADGTELILALLEPGDVIGALTIGESPDNAHSIVSLDPTNLFWIDRKEFEKCVRTMPALSANLSTVLGRGVRRANERIEALAGMDVRSRLVRHLLLLARDYGQPTDTAEGSSVRIPLRLTQGDLAHLVGASRASVNQAVSELRRRGAMGSCGDHCLVISDMASLERLR